MFLTAVQFAHTQLMILMIKICSFVFEVSVGDLNKLKIRSLSLIYLKLFLIVTIAFGE
jgi:hypothetical protein